MSDWDASETASLGVGCVVTCGASLTALDCARDGGRRTEWVLLTSGTTGLPKLTLHTLSSLTGAITGDTTQGSSIVWSTFYDIRRYGGLQIFLRALLSGGSLVLSSAQESTGDFLSGLVQHGVTHISGTPSHWRRALMSPSARRIAPRYVRLSGEIADQAILDSLRAFYQDADDRPCIRVDRGRRGVRGPRRSRRLSGGNDRQAEQRRRDQDRGRFASDTLSQDCGPLPGKRDARGPRTASSIPATWSNYAATAITSSAAGTG